MDSIQIPITLNLRNSACYEQRVYRISTSDGGFTPIQIWDMINTLNINSKHAFKHLQTGAKNNWKHFHYDKNMASELVQRRVVQITRHQTH